MASVSWPTDIVPTSAEPEFIDFSAELTPDSGGPDQKILRAGRFRVTFTFPPLTPDQARRAVSRLIQGKQNGLIIPFQQPGYDMNVGGTVVVAGSGQTGTSLNIGGITGASTIKEGGFASVTASGRRYLYLISADAAVSLPAGNATISLRPMIRKSPADGGLVEIATPKIEGWITSAANWSIKSAVEYGLQFTVQEAA